MKQQIWLQCRAAESENRRCTKNLRALLDDRNFDETEADVGTAPFDSDVEECRKKNGGGLETQEGGEEEDTEGVDHYEDASHWLMVPHAASDTNAPEMRALPWHHGINQCGKTTLMRATVHEQQRVSPNMTS